MEGSEGSLVKHFIGPYIKVFLAWASDSNIEEMRPLAALEQPFLCICLKKAW